MFIMMGAVAYFIVVERKGLGMMQLRHGPNKVGFKGLVQPLADGVKLFKKEYCFPHPLTKVTYAVGPIMCFTSAYGLYLVFPVSFSSVHFELGMLFFLCVSSFSVYGVIVTGWLCNSRYAFLGAMRAVAQTISYEVFMSTALFGILLLVGSYDLTLIRLNVFFTGSLGFVSLGLWVIAVLAETNRAPFDFVEGESELVAGYMTEVSGGGFALLALAEYSNMMFVSMLTGVIFFNLGMGATFFGDLVFAGWTVFFSYAFVWVRATMPRYRYDLLMNLCWTLLLPVSLSMFALILAIAG
uniref:NADH-ubiquinone oxidoreductase chain 1 n=1 Tax=Spisula sachalinensis TaxID=81899 RepID=A0A2H4U912_SPISA|nr:NADH dehydrogenase subunit 1 [Pseudocardium sachalinense]